MQVQPLRHGLVIVLCRGKKTLRSLTCDLKQVAAVTLATRRLLSAFMSTRFSADVTDVSVGFLQLGTGSRDRTVTLTPPQWYNLRSV